MNELINKLKWKNLTLFGEIHGTKEIPLILFKFFKILSKKESFNVCLEIPEIYQKNINDFLKSGYEKNLLNINFFTDKNQRDGRNSLEYYNLIKSLYNLKNKIGIYCIDTNIPKEQNEREMLMADNIIKTSSLNKKTFVVLGNIHASKNKIILNSLKITPTGYFLYKKLGNNMTNVLLVCKKGFFFNIEKKKINENDFKYFLDEFDLIYKIKEVTPCSFLSIY